MILPFSRPPTCSPIHPFTCPPSHLPTSLSIRLSIYPTPCPSFHPPQSSIFPTTNHSNTCLTSHPSIRPPVHHPPIRHPVWQPLIHLDILDTGAGASAQLSQDGQIKGTEMNILRAVHRTQARRGFQVSFSSPRHKGCASCLKMFPPTISCPVRASTTPAYTLGHPFLTTSHCLRWLFGHEVIYHM